MGKLTRATVVLTLGIWLTGCATHPPMPGVEQVDLDRYMGDWYVIASIPTFIEKEAFNAVESYHLNDDGTVQTTFRFNKGSSDGPEKIYRSKAYVLDTTSNAHWGMQFVWPFKAEYRVIYLAEDYSRTMIGRSKRDYVWIMARKPEIPAQAYGRILKFLTQQGYDVEKLIEVPHATRSNSG